MSSGYRAQGVKEIYFHNTICLHQSSVFADFLFLLSMIPPVILVCVRSFDFVHFLSDLDSGHTIRGGKLAFSGWKHLWRLPSWPGLLHPGGEENVSDDLTGHSIKMSFGKMENIT